MRTRSRTRKCFVTACLVSFVPWVSALIEYRRPSLNLANKSSRVSSPRAAKAAACTRALLRCFPDIVRDIFHLLRPSAIVAQKRFCAPFRGNHFETGLGHRQQG